MVSLIFQPRFGEDTYPIGRLVLECARALGITRTELVSRLGHRDLGKGHKALSAMLLTGVLAPQVANHLAEALEVDDALVESVIGTTTHQKRDESRKRRVESEEAYRDSF